ncbi:dnaJ homolog subfamily C member 24 isoform X2 [Sphaeramia orbicularis]|uniref:dnaJ homolog subfamily C member 24 isoform X2 n=1 Tax=Sphaeramia orbicularis TaxID=375764 RepID=UPI00117ED893|nr:dnaJ homolog subfamily C member 24 isoform X2 [Sphaeramia orbicularis]
MCESVETDLYAVLGASPSESVQQLRRRYQQLALKFHPDRLKGQSSTEAESNKRNFLEVDAAWRILSDQNSRMQYDLHKRDQCVYTSCCRCGGGFSLTEEEVMEETQSGQEDVEEKNPDKGDRGLVVCCDTCSLSVYVMWSEHTQTQNCSVKKGQ